jgi:hypothetical protein
MFKLEIETDNAAFEGGWQYETERILHEVIEGMRQGRDTKPLYDINGNTVGSFTYTGE